MLDLRLLAEAAAEHGAEAAGHAEPVAFAPNADMTVEP